MIIGVTGGMGCGKSTFSSILSKKLNAPVLDADKISREAMNSTEIVTKICTFFSNDILDSNGNIDRKKVALLAFTDQNKLKKLNDIIHPYVMKKIREQINKLKADNKYIILDVPLPIPDFKMICDYIITVWADLDIRIKRIAARSNMTNDEILARIKKQMPQKDYETLANIVVYNNDSIESLEEKANKLVELLKEKN